MPRSGPGGLKRYPEAELHRAVFSRNPPEVLRVVFLRIDRPVRAVEHVERLRQHVDRQAAGQRNPLLDAQVRSLARRLPTAVQNPPSVYGTIQFTVPTSISWL